MHTFFPPKTSNCQYSEVLAQFVAVRIEIENVNKNPGLCEGSVFCVSWKATKEWLPICIFHYLSIYCNYLLNSFWWSIYSFLHFFIHWCAFSQLYTYFDIMYICNHVYIYIYIHRYMNSIYVYSDWFIHSLTHSFFHSFIATPYITTIKQWGTIGQAPEHRIFLFLAQPSASCGRAGWRAPLKSYIG